MPFYLNGQISQDKKSFSLPAGSSIFLNPANDTITAPDYVRMLNSGLFTTRMEVSNGSKIIVRLDSTDILKTINRKSPLTVLTLDNKNKVNTSSKKTILLFWNIHCKPCLEEMDEVVAQSKQVSKDVNFIFVSSDDSLSANRILKGQIKYYKTITGDSAINKLFQITSLPTTIFIDKQNIIKYIHIGKLNKDLLPLSTNVF